MSDIFTLSDEITKYNAQESVDFFSDLLCKEAQRICVPLTAVNCPLSINVGDGGIDASAKNPERNNSNLFISDDVRFQIKADDAKPWQKSVLLKELFNLTSKKYNTLLTPEQKRNNLKPAIKKCLDDNATYIYVSFKHEFVEKNYIATKNSIKEFFKESGYPNANVEVWGYNHINQVIKANFPAILLNIKTQRNNLSNLLYDRFSKNPDYINKYYADESRKEIIDSIRTLLLSPNHPRQAMHIRIIGASGIGKTKTVLEALNIKELKNNCLIFDSAERYINEAFVGYFQGDESIVLVIDECNETQAEEIYKQLKFNFPYIKLVTIYNSCNENNRENCFVVQELEENALSTILKQNFSPIITDHGINQIIKLCGGFPRVAIKVAENVRDNPDNTEKYLDNLDSFWLKYVSNKSAIDAPETKDKIRLLEYFSLFERFGYKGSNIEEFNYIKSIIIKNNNISEDDIDFYVNELKQKSILRGESVLYISPRIFQNWLKKQWYKKKNDFNYDAFTSGMPVSLITSFNKELSELEPENKRQVICSKFNTLDDFEKQSLLFGRLIYKNDDEAFDRLESIIEETSEIDLKTPRLNVKGFLMYFAKQEKYFERASNLLFNIACLEDKTWYSNNAKSDFTELFTIFYNTDMASTYIPLEQKSVYLQNLLKTENTEQELELILNAITQGIINPLRVTKSESNSNSVSYLRLNEQINFTDIEYKYISELLILTIKILDKTNTSELIKKCNYILINKPLYLLQDNKTFDFSFKYYTNLINENNAKLDLMELIKQIDFSFKYDHFNKLSNENITKVKSLYEMLRQHAGFDNFKTICINNSYLGDNEIENLRILLKNGCLNNDENIKFLFSENSQLSRIVGIEQAKIVNNLSYLDYVLNIYEEINFPPNIDFILGFIWGSFLVSPQETENKIINITPKESIFKLLPIIIRMAETDKTVRFLFDYVKCGVFDLSEFNISGNNCSLDLLTEIIEYLLSKEGDYPVRLIMQILSSSSFYGKKAINFNKDLVVKCLLKSIESTFSKGQTDAYIWDKLAKKYINEEASLEILLNMFQRIIETSESFLDSYVKSSLCHISQLYPNETWERFSILLDNPKSYKLHVGGNELWVNNGLLSIFNQDLIFKWIEEKIDTRLHIIANLAPDKFLPHQDNKDCQFYRELLIKYPRNKELFNTLSCRSFSGSYWGKESDTVKGKIEAIKMLIENETENAVLKWLKQELSYNEKRLKSALEREERFDND